MPLFKYEGPSFSWSQIEQYVAPAFEGYASAARSDFINAAEAADAPDQLVDMLDSLHEGKQYRSLDELKQDLVSLGHATE